ncbi:MAG: phosphopantetheine-binding protein [Acetobacteraceae bacterium]|jgi:acyl carrier protein
MDELEAEIKKMLVEALKLEDLTPDEIASDEPLFGDGLGLDSIDALEIGVELRKRYGIRIESVTEDVKAHFANVRSLAQFIRSQQRAAQ